MSRIQNLLNKAERDGTVRRTRSLVEDDSARRALARTATGRTRIGEFSLLAPSRHRRIGPDGTGKRPPGRDARVGGGTGPGRSLRGASIRI